MHQSIRRMAALAALATLAVAGTATASVPGLEIVRTASVTNSQNKTDFAFCPTGKQVLGGGARISDGAGQVAFTKFTPSASLPKLVVQANEDADGFAGNWTMQGFGVCANPVPGYQIVSADSVSNSLNKLVSVDCPDGKAVLGGGGEVVGPGGRISITQMTPNGDLDSMVLLARELQSAYRRDRVDLEAPRLRRLRERAGRPPGGQRGERPELGVVEVRDRHVPRGQARARRRGAHQGRRRQHRSE